MFVVPEKFKAENYVEVRFPYVLHEIESLSQKLYMEMSLNIFRNLFSLIYPQIYKGRVA